MNPDNYGLIELVFAFGLVLAFLFWQLFSVRRSMAEDARKAQDRGEPPPR